MRCGRGGLFLGWQWGDLEDGPMIRVLFYDVHSYCISHDRSIPWGDCIYLLSFASPKNQGKCMYLSTLRFSVSSFRSAVCLFLVVIEGKSILVVIFHNPAPKM